ncbi:MAG TPA: hypothetical protein VF998_10590 [Candidatus Limnocylindria bacterium]
MTPAPGPAASTVYFHEEQRFGRSLLWLAVLVPLVLAVVVVGASPRSGALALALTVVVLLGVAALLAVAYLETEVTGDAVVVAFHGLWPTRRIWLDEIAGYEARRYSIWDSGGWGVHFGLAGMTYNVSGNGGVAFELHSGAHVLVGSQHAGELTDAISKAMEARRPL